MGGNDELVFDGQSLVLGGKGGVLAMGAAFRQEVKVVDLHGKEEKPVWAGEEEQVFRALVLGTKDYLQKCGFREVVLGLSGGIDSALTAVIAAEAVGSDQVLGVPVVVLSNNDGCIISRSEEAKALGIPMGAPLHEQKEVIRKHGVRVFSSNYTLYVVS